MVVGCLSPHRQRNLDDGLGWSNGIGSNFRKLPIDRFYLGLNRGKLGLQLRQALGTFFGGEPLGQSS